MPEYHTDVMRLAAVNPLLPSWYDMVWSGIALAALAVSIIALVSIVRAKDVTGLRALLWIVVVLALPVIGAARWFAIGRADAVANTGTRTASMGTSAVDLDRALQLAAEDEDAELVRRMRAGQ